MEREPPAIATAPILVFCERTHTGRSAGSRPIGCSGLQHDPSNPRWRNWERGQWRERGVGADSLRASFVEEAYQSYSLTNTLAIH